MVRSHRPLSVVLRAVLAVGSIASLASAQAWDVRLSIQSRNAGGLQTRGIPAPNNIIGGAMGLHPDGPDEIASDPTFYARHTAEYTADLNATIPDRNFTGVVMIDYEHFWPAWEWSGPSQPAWRNYIKTQRPELLAGKLESEWEAIFAQSFRDEVKQYWIFTANLTRQLRPKAQVTFYGLPLGTYWIFNGYSQAGVNLTRYRDIHERELAWYWDLVDVVTPTIYANYSISNTPDRKSVV